VGEYFVNTECPFKVGDVVFYWPSARGWGLSANDRPSQKLNVGEAARIAEITDGKYIVPEGYSHPGGGLYWTEFSTS
jgi:hypothetical protein